LTTTIKNLLSLITLFFLMACAKEKDVEPIPTPVKPALIDFEYTVNTDRTVTFKNISNYGETFEWNFADVLNGKSNESSPTYYYRSNGSFEVALKAIGKDGVKTIKKTIQVNVNIPIPSTAYILAIDKYRTPASISIKNTNFTGDVKIVINKIALNKTTKVFEQETKDLFKTGISNTISINESGLYSIDYIVSNATGTATKTDSLVIFGSSTINDFSEVSLNGINVKARNKNIDIASNQKAFLFLYQKTIRLQSQVPTWFYEFCKTVPIWIDDINKFNGAAQYNSDCYWLNKNNDVLAKENCVEITNLTNYLDWNIRAQPEMLLHEYAHAYHDQILQNGFDNAIVLEAYKKAIASTKYNMVKYILGGEQKHYANNNQMEYFAEMTESYFGKNDFQPYTKTELKTFDPNSYQLMESIYGKY
jgi:PKD repeat protein